MVMACKQALFDLICKTFAEERNRYNHYITHPKEVEKR